jgi:photosynthetic reaction center cytochrome c subunit
MKIRKRVLASLGTFIVMGAVVGTLKAHSGHVPQHSGPDIGSPAQMPRKAEEQFKNIRILKGIPAEQLFPTMEFMSASLGVNCEFCHVKNAFEKDDKKPKQTARKMMEMMFAINKDNFDGRRNVTCYSCHRGDAKPLAIPVVMTEEPKTTGEPHGAVAGGTEKESSAGSPSAEQLLDKYVQALGGAAALENISSRVMKGTIEFGEQSMPIDIYAKEPDRRISFAHTPNGDSVTAFDGHEGWLASSGRPPHFMQGTEIDAASIDADLHLATHLPQMFSAMKVDGHEKIGDREAYVVVGERQGKTPLKLYFDKQSGLLLRLVRYGETAVGWLPTQIDYADYREANGIKVPYRWTLARPNGRFTIQLTELKQNVPVDDAKFAKPAPEQPKPPTK